MKIKQMLVIGMAAAYLSLGSMAHAADASVEIMGARKDTQKEITTLDTKISGSMASKIEYFCRNRISVDDRRSVGAFSLVDLDYSLGKGFDIVYETQFSPGVKAEPRVGFEYFKKIKDVALFIEATEDFKDKPSTEVVTSVKYTPRLSDKVRLVMRGESIIRRVADSYDIERLRVGVDIKGTEIGAGTDISGLLQEGRPTHSEGLYVLVPL